MNLKWAPVLIATVIAYAGLAYSQDDLFFLYRIVPLTRVIANPESFDGQLIGIVGFVDVTKGNGALLFPTKEYARVRIVGESICLEFDESEFDEEEIESLNGEYTLVYGRFDSSQDGMAEYRSGSLVEIKKITPWYQ